MPADYMRSLLIASGEGQAMPHELSEEAMAFFALPNSKSAHIHLNSLLESSKVGAPFPQLWQINFMSVLSVGQT